jgi:hypothetical protein
MLPNVTLASFVLPPAIEHALPSGAKRFWVEVVTAAMAYGVEGDRKVGQQKWWPHKLSGQGPEAEQVRRR